ncbi:MAG: acyl carrier protein [Isosphaeraceae bacterium]
MAESNLIAEITQFVQTIGRIDADSAIHPDQVLDEELGLDSLAIVEVILKVEDKYGLTIDENEASRLRTIRQVADYVAAHQHSAAA